MAALPRIQIVGPTWAHPAYAGRMMYARDDQELVAVELPLAAGQTGQTEAKAR